MNSEDVRNDPRMKAHWNKLARDRWKAECEAWRNQAGVWLIVDGNTLIEITEAAATDAARGGAE